MMSKTGSRKGFTLLEIMVTTAIVSLAAVFIFQSLFLTLDTADAYAHTLSVIPWAEEKVWQAQDSLRRYGSLSGLSETSGKFINKKKEFSWSLMHDFVDEKSELYKITLLLSWQAGQRKKTLSRTAYAKFKKE